MPVQNVTETIVRHVLSDNFLEPGRLPCNCQRCQDDIVALTLNALPTRYASSDAGQVYFKTQILNTQLQSDILRELLVAIAVVQEHPRHVSAP
jgi:competence protein ComFB